MNDPLLRTGPADRALAEAAAVTLAHLGEQSAPPRVVRGEQLRRPKQFGVAPVRADFLPAWRIGVRVILRICTQRLFERSTLLPFP